MGWNYRVLSHPDGWLVLHEVHFDDDSPETPHSCTRDGCSFAGDDVEEIRAGLNRALKALDKPDIPYNSIGSEILP